jgi:hypothetical protein
MVTAYRQNNKGRASVFGASVFSGGAVIMLGMAELSDSQSFHIATGLGSEIAASIIAVQWIVFGVFLFIGGLFSRRLLTTYAADFLMLSSICAAIVLLVNSASPMALAIQFLIAVLAFVSSSLIPRHKRAVPHPADSTATNQEDHEIIACKRNSDVE